MPLSVSLLAFKRLLSLVILTSVIGACGQSSAPGELFTPGAANERWAVINYWAVWCAPCREEIPELNELARKHADSVRVFGVNFDGAQGDKLNTAIEELGIEFPVLEKDPQPELGIARPQALPVTVLIKPDGTVAEVLLGPQTTVGLWQKISDLQTTPAP